MPSDYNASSIQHLKGLEGVRKRPSMYLGDTTNGDALHRMIFEVVDNSVDEYLAGHATFVKVIIEEDELVTVIDDGRGIPPDYHEESGMSALTLVLTTLHAGGKFGDQISSGLHGVGVAAVNALSRHFDATVYRDGKQYSQAFEGGTPMTPVLEGKASPTARGTEISFVRDETFFGGDERAHYDTQWVGDRLEELAFLNPGLRCEMIDHRWGMPCHHSFQYANGIADYLANNFLDQKSAITPVIAFKEGTGGCEVAMAWTSGEGCNIRAYANNTCNKDGGTHVQAFKAALTRILLGLGREAGILKKDDPEVTGEDLRAGLVAVLSIRAANLAYSSQTKERLVSPYGKVLVDDLFNDQVDYWFHNNLPAARVILGRAVLAARQREAARNAWAGVARKEVMDGFSLPGKLSDCQSKMPEECELFLVEGDSAGGSSKQARDRKFQAVLPLRGKVLNVERATLEAILDNQEIGTIIAALGCGIEQSNFRLDGLRYHKIILMTDADVDGSHIRTLLLTFFFRCMPQLVYGGHIFIAQPPLYGVKVAGLRASEAYLRSDTELSLYFDSLPAHQQEKAHVTRYKGLGEMNAEALANTTMDPNQRTLKEVTVQDAVEAEKLFEMLMGDDVPMRRQFIEQNAAYAKVDV